MWSGVTTVVRQGETERPALGAHGLDDTGQRAQEGRPGGPEGPPGLPQEETAAIPAGAANSHRGYRARERGSIRHARARSRHIQDLLSPFPRKQKGEINVDNTAPRYKATCLDEAVALLDTTPSDLNRPTMFPPSAAFSPARTGSI